jgi:sugar phosphate permease
MITFTKKEQDYRAYFLWSLASLFFFFQFIIRLVPGVLKDDIMSRFNLNDLEFANLSAYYYFGYALCQIPLGIMLDRINFRIITFTSILTVAIGVGIFANADNITFMTIGRFLTGVGSGVAFLAVV